MVALHLAPMIALHLHLAPMVQSCSDDGSALGFDDGSAPMMFLLSRSDDGSAPGFDDGSALGWLGTWLR